MAELGDESKVCVCVLLYLTLENLLFNTHYSKILGLKNMLGIYCFDIY